jgi:hypothetical protein
MMAFSVSATCMQRMQEHVVNECILRIHCAAHRSLVHSLVSSAMMEATGKECLCLQWSDCQENT